jgi:hypothetical protein
MRDSRLNHVLGQVINTDSHHIHKVSDYLGRLTTPQLLIAVVQAS